MRLATTASPAIELGHLCYCTNIHPAESWDETRAALGKHLPAIKAQVSPLQPFGVGLRLSALAARQLETQAGLLPEFLQFLARHQLYVFTLNGFPYGRFHGPGAKHQVYLPDWRHPERLEYSDRLARLLSHLLPPDIDGSISTLPGAYAAHLRQPDQELPLIADNLLRHAATLHHLHMESGRCIRLALEPEPECLLETTRDAILFFQRHLLTASALTRLANLCHCPPGHAETLLRRHLGVCLDCCHAAVEFEDIESSLDQLAAAGIALVKLQLSVGLKLADVQPGHQAQLQSFADDHYLHQVVQRTPAGLRRFDDLPAALSQLEQAQGAEWRIHFHVPLWAQQLGDFSSTQDCVRQVLARHRRQSLTSHLEVETYSWHVLPPGFRAGNLDDAICQELSWVKEQLQ
ncbi:metabolite traffic protein EboE [Chromobacterium subtsugae]|uniref:metabolite traffic protein EboE n=1 Tax=Chromobacterium subtsugae TaxID=251747 RepID=UPI00069B35E0|nr:metabolite traffic protein EboE [Chromobacterium subtsugae]